MRTLGIDLAADPKRTASCMVEWRTGVGVVEDPRNPSPSQDDAFLLARIRQADRAGIDAPFGWPEPFVEALVEHRWRRGWPPGEQRKRLRFRETDRYVA